MTGGPRIWRYSTEPKRSFDTLLRALLRPLMLTAAGGKFSHWFDWYNQRIALQAGLTVPGSNASFSKRWLWDETRMSLGGWQDGAVLQPEPDVPWQIAYRLGRVDDEIIIRRCSLVLHGPVRVLRGPGEATYFALSPGTDDMLGLRIIGRFRSRNAKQWRHIPLI